MTTATNPSAAQLLDEWLTNGVLTSQYHTYLDSHILTGDSFYTKTLAKKGQEAADAALYEWNERGRMSDFAAGIEPVARGMLALAQASTKDDLVKVIEVKERMPYPTSFSISNPSQMVVAFNHHAPGCGCQQPKGSDLFSIYGRLGLKAVTLQVGYSRQLGKRTAQLGLVLPYRALKLARQTEDGYVVAAIELTGWTDGHNITPVFYGDEALMYSLGLAPLDRAVRMINDSGGHFDDAIGFPGATSFLADSMPVLGKYFADLAKMLGSDHKN